MLDNRIYTFLELCSVMNYHKTAENLNMTQPAVTQHIKYFENLYNCKLFDYSNKKLQKTQNCLELEKCARTMISLNLSLAESLNHNEKIKINIGATKTIGDYILDTSLWHLICDEKYELNIIIDNTEKLTERLSHFDLDLLILEGYVDKEKYCHQKISDEEIVGICSVSHPFAFKEVSIKEIFEQSAILREKGSGTRAVFEQFLLENGYSTKSFKQKSVISSNKLIELSVQNNCAISFVYSIIPSKNKNLATFKIKDNKIFHEFNYVFLNDKKAKEIINLIEN
ncbi:MAG: LysR family transcriptional regulator [Clostridia bacterium]